MIKMIEGGVKLGRMERLHRSLKITRDVFQNTTGKPYTPEIFPKVDLKVNKIIAEIIKGIYF